MPKEYDQREDQSVETESTTLQQTVTDERPEAQLGRQLQDMANNSVQAKEGPKKKVNNTGIPDRLKAAVEHFSGFSLDEVKVHYNSEKPALVGALAYTDGLNIYISPGAEKHLAHELWHIVQKMKGDVSETTQVNGMGVNDDKRLEQDAETMGTRASRTTPTEGEDTELEKRPLASGIVQRYVETTGSPKYRVSEDMSAVVKVGYPNHKLYAKAGKADQANAKLQAAGSGIELEEQSGGVTVTEGSTSVSLKQILPKNKQNGTSGTDMELWADCGMSSGVVVGSDDRSAIYSDPTDGGKTAKTGSRSPSLMKSEIILKLYQDWLARPTSEVSDTIKQAIRDVQTKAQPYYDAANKAYQDGLKYKVSDPAKFELYVGEYWRNIDIYANTNMEFYDSQSEDIREEIDAYLKINKAANPDVGQGYTMSSGGDEYSGVSTWNFHWGGVVMKSDDGADNITLENYAVGDATVENKKWDMAMYGTKKDGQTFHEQHHDTKQHGKTPTTMVVEKA
ncbi:MAG: DUF4157 domain-containing protein [Aureispira sp.]